MNLTMFQRFMPVQLNDGGTIQEIDILFGEKKFVQYLYDEKTRVINRRSFFDGKETCERMQYDAR